MKKFITITTLFLFSFNTIVSQSEEKKAVSKGKHAINLYYGVSLTSSIYKSLAAEALDLKFKTIGPVGIVYEYLVTDGIGIGAEFGYTQLTMTYSEEQTDPATNTLTKYSAEWQFVTMRAMFRANFHFANSEKFDAYGLVSAGYRNSTYKFKTNDPNYTTAITFSGIIPFGIKPGLGFRYFFTDNIGLNLEIAIGTPLLCGGVALKF